MLNERFKHPFVVVKGFRFNVLLGLDFLKKFDAKINVNKNLILENSVFNFVSEDTPKVRMETNCLIPARTEIVVRAKIDSAKIPLVQVALVEPSGTHRIAIARTISQVNDGFVYVNCVNYSKEDVMLHSGSVIGTLTSFSIISALDADVVTHPRELEQLVSNTELTRKEQEELMHLLANYIDVFSFDGKFGNTHLVKHRINTGNAIPVYKKLYRTSVTENEVISKEINKMLEEGIVRPPTSP